MAVRHGFLLPSRVAMAVCRGKLLAAVRRAVQQGQRRLPAGMRPQRCDNRLNTLGRQQWHVHIRERYPHAERGAHLPGALWAWWASREPAAGVMRTGGGPLPVPGAWGGRCSPAVRPPDVIHRRIHPAVSLARAGTWDEGGPWLWAVCADQA